MKDWLRILDSLKVADLFYRNCNLMKEAARIRELHRRITLLVADTLRNAPDKEGDKERRK